MEAAKSEFLKVVNRQFEQHCKSKEIEPSSEYFLEYLLKRNIITDLIIKRFVVVTAYPEALSMNMSVKKLAIWQLEDKFDISDSSIKQYLQRHQEDFRPKID